MSAEQRTLMLAEARELLGTRWRHQARVKGAGVDCIGVIVLCCRAAGIEVADRTNYARRAGGGFIEAVRDHCDRITLAEVIPADFMVFAWTAEPRHIGIVSAPGMIIHSYAEVRKVVENSLDAFWLDRLRGCYRLKALA